MSFRTVLESERINEMTWKCYWTEEAEEEEDNNGGIIFLIYLFMIQWTKKNSTHVRKGGQKWFSFLLVLIDERERERQRGVGLAFCIWIHQRSLCNVLDQKKKKKKKKFGTFLLISSPSQASILFRKERGIPMVIIKNERRRRKTRTMVDCSIIWEFLVDSLQWIRGREISIGESFGAFRC